MDAYLAGLDQRLAAGLRIDHVASVASFFVSRMDTKVDSLLLDSSPFRGKTAIAYTKIAYDEFRKVFSGARFARQQAAGGRLQRPLWASTSTKNPAYPDTLYVNNLIGPGTVNTVPPKTLEAFIDHGIASATLMEHLEEARIVLNEVESSGISMENVTEELEIEGVKSFEDAFAAILSTIDERCSAAVKELGLLAVSVPRRVANLVEDAVPNRLWSHDPTLWTTDKADQEEISNRLGWLDLPTSIQGGLRKSMILFPE